MACHSKLSSGMTIIPIQASHRLYVKTPSCRGCAEFSAGLYIALHGSADVMPEEAFGHVVEDRLGDFMNLAARTEQEGMLPHGGDRNVLARSAMAPGVNTGISG